MPAYNVWLYATRRLQERNQGGRNQHSLRSLIWVGHAPSGAEAGDRARRALRLALGVIAAMTGTALADGDLSVDEVAEDMGDANCWPKIILGEIIAEQLAKAGAASPRLRADAHDVEAVLGDAMRCVLADRAEPPESGTHILSAAPGKSDHALTRDVDMGYAVLTPGADGDIEPREGPDALAVLQTLAAAYRLCDPRGDDDRTEGTVAIPESATLRAAAHAELRATRREDGRRPAAFLREFGCEAEARIFDGMENHPQ